MHSRIKLGQDCMVSWFSVGIGFSQSKMAVAVILICFISYSLALKVLSAV
jgi:hypothetical protein